MQTWQRIKRLFWRGAASDVVAGRTFDLIAQGSHVGWGIALVLGPVALFGPLALWPAALVTLFASPSRNPWSTQRSRAQQSAAPAGATSSSRASGP